MTSAAGATGLSYTRHYDTTRRDGWQRGYRSRSRGAPLIPPTTATATRCSSKIYRSGRSDLGQAAFGSASPNLPRIVPCAGRFPHPAPGQGYTCSGSSLFLSRPCPSSIIMSAKRASPVSCSRIPLIPPSLTQRFENTTPSSCCPTGCRDLPSLSLARPTRVLLR